MYQRILTTFAFLGMCLYPCELAAGQFAPPAPVSYAPVVKMAAPAVVSISTVQTINVPNSLFSNDPFFNFFFGNLDGEGSRQQDIAKSLGSGVIVDPSGIVVTCAHVVENSNKIMVKLADNREYEGEVIVKDTQNDLAAIRLRNVPSNLPLPAIALETHNVEVGDLILAIGNPFGVGQTVTNGIISAIARNVRGRMLIQTDAPINPGNSGGALISMQGKLVGIPNAILSKTGANHGIGFAIPEPMIQALLNSINNGGVIIHPWTGIDIQRLTPDLAASLGLQTPQGVLISALHPASPALAAGVRQGDVVMAVNGQNTPTQEDFLYRLQPIPLGQDIVLTLQRNAQTLGITFKAIEPPAIPAPNRRRISQEIPLLQGIEVANLSPALISQDQLPLGTPEKGVVVTDPGKSMLALRMNLQKGDIIEAINGNRIDSVEIFFKALPNFQLPQGSITIRQGNRRIEINHR